MASKYHKKIDTFFDLENLIIKKILKDPKKRVFNKKIKNPEKLGLIKLIEEKYPGVIQKSTPSKIYFENQKKAIKILFDPEILEYLMNCETIETQIWKNNRYIRMSET